MIDTIVFCCAAMINAQLGRAVEGRGGAYYVGSHLPAMVFCPWCGAHIGRPRA